MTDDGLARRFYDLLRGLDRVHGRTTVGRGEPGQKAPYVSRSYQQPVTVDLWQQHLAGELGLGITPVDDEGRCRWGAIDVDRYDLDLPALARRCHDLDLPLVLCRTKSGGAHLFLFLTEPTEAAAVRRALASWVAVLGYPPSTEIFPKQDSTEGDGFGSWLNMPYHGGEDSLRYALDPETGEALTPEDFVNVALELAVDPADLDDLATVVKFPGGTAGGADEDPRLPGAPPCLTLLAQRPPGEETPLRNVTLFNFGVYHKLVDIGTTEAKLRELARSFNPALTDQREIAKTVASVLRRSYSYQCKISPLRERCDRETCQGRRYGITAALAKTNVKKKQRPEQVEAGDLGPLYHLPGDPARWKWIISGQSVYLTPDQLFKQDQFRNRVLEQTKKLLPALSANAWGKLISQRAAAAPTLATPTASNRRDLAWEMLGTYCTGRAQARTLDETLLGKPFTETGRTRFQAISFLDWCRKQGFALAETQLYEWLQERGLDFEEVTLKGRAVQLYSVPEFTAQSEAFDVPRDPSAAEL